MSCGVTWCTLDRPHDDHSHETTVCTIAGVLIDDAGRDAGAGHAQLVVRGTSETQAAPVLVLVAGIESVRLELTWERLVVLAAQQVSAVGRWRGVV